jgi:hypothetical protein
LSGDQRLDDARSLTWDFAAPSRPVVGYPTLRIRVSASAPAASLSVKLCDVFPDGTSALAARGILNLAHRDGHEAPVPLEPGVPVAVEIELEATSWVFEAGHRVRLSLAGADWPNVWPPPAGGTLLVDRASVELTLPVLEGPAVAPPPVLPPSTGKDTHTPDGDEEQPLVWRHELDVIAREARAVTSYGSRYEGEQGARIEERYDGEVGVSTEDPARAWARGVSEYRIAWPEAEVRTEARLDLRSDADSYHVLIELVAEETGGGIGRIERRFERTVPRSLQ